MFTIGERQVPREDDSGETISLTLRDLLSFVTGCDYPPLLGFPQQPSIYFTDDAKRLLPWASTYSCSLHISLHLTVYEDFQKAMDTALICAHGFGTV